MTVVDVNIIVYAITASELTPAARRLLERTPDVVVPPLWRSECLSALVVLARSGRITSDHAQEAFVAAWQAFQPRERDVDYSSAMQLALERNISAYDAQYVALALRSGGRLVTNDKKLVSRCGDVATLLYDAGNGREMQ